MNQNGDAKSYKTTTVIDPVSSSNPTSSKNEEPMLLGSYLDCQLAREPVNSSHGQLVTRKNCVTS